MKRTWKISQSANNQFKLNVHASGGGKSVATFGENLTKEKHAVDMALSLSKTTELQELDNTLGEIQLALEENDKKYALKLIKIGLKVIRQSLDKVIVIPAKAK